MEFEVCCNGFSSVIAAVKAGATRVELCSNMLEGGTTPSLATIGLSKAYIDLEGSSTKLHVLIRPRGGDFLYDDDEIMVMKSDIMFIEDAIKPDGFVIGALKPDGSIDTDKCRELMAEAPGKSFTFHRAFDMCSDPLKAIDQLAELGFERILTSGRCRTAEEGIILLKALQEHAQGKIKLMAGCGVNEKNIRRIWQQTGITAFHFSARRTVKSKMTYRNEEVVMGAEGADEYNYQVSTADSIRRIMAQLPG